MRYAPFVTASAVALALAGCGKKSEPDAQATSAAEIASSAGEAPAPPPESAGQTFANTAAASDAFEIETSKLAADKAASPKIKTFAANMIKHHTESTAKLKSVAGGLTPAILPAAQLSPTQQQTLDDLKTKAGADFDKAYAAAQVNAHQQTLDVLKAYAASGDVPALKGFATEMVPVVTAHLNMAKAL